MTPDLKTRIGNWIFRPQSPEVAPVHLHRRRVFILPTRQGLTFAFTLLLMLVGAINYNLSLGYVLIFLLGSMGMVSMLHTFRNIAGLALRPGRAVSVMAGQMAGFEVLVENKLGFTRYSIALQAPHHTAVFADVSAHQRVLVKLPVKTLRRGRLPLGRLTVSTSYPLGLFRAWSNVELDLSCLVYPRPDGSRWIEAIHHARQGDGTEHGIGHDDFTSLRPHHPSDSPRHVAWKAVARQRGMLTKQFSGRADKDRWFEWEALPQLDVEAKLSRLCQWVLDAEAAGKRYGLRLPGQVFEPGRGEVQQRQCLDALALFGNSPREMQR